MADRVPFLIVDEEGGTTYYLDAPSPSTEEESKDLDRVRWNVVALYATEGFLVHYHDHLNQAYPSIIICANPGPGWGIALTHDEGDANLHLVLEGEAAILRAGEPPRKPMAGVHLYDYNPLDLAQAVLLSEAERA